MPRRRPDHAEGRPRDSRDGAACRRDGGAAELTEALYRELRAVAHHYMGGQPSGHMLQTTALVHEAFVRLAASDPSWADREHFLAVAARAMRHVLIDHARARLRSGRRESRLSATTVTLAAWDPGHPVDLIAIHDALERLGRIDRELEEIVELRVFAGLALPAVAKAAKISLRTAERRWQLARAWLRADLSKG